MSRNLRKRPWEGIPEPKQLLPLDSNHILQHGSSSVAGVALKGISTPNSSSVAGVAPNSISTPNQQNGIEEDISSEATISDCSSDDWASSDYEEELVVSDDEVDQLDWNEAGKAVDDAPLEASPCVPRSGEDPASFYQRLKNAFKSKKPTKVTWKNSWQKEHTPAWLNVYGYYDKDNNYGGYGVIIRSESVKPIIAATCFIQGTQGEQSQLLQVCKGLKIGLGFASQCRGHLNVCCNMEKAVYLLGKSTFQKAGACLASTSCHTVISGICRDCTKHRSMVDDNATFNALISLMKEIIDLQAKLGCGFYFSRVPRRQNEAAHWLAKDAKKRNQGEVTIQPTQFPKELNDILWRDAFGLSTIYSNSLLLNC